MVIHFYGSYFIPGKMDPHGLYSSASDCFETFNMLLSSNDEIAELFRDLQSLGCNLQYGCDCCNENENRIGYTSGWRDSIVTIAVCWNLIDNDFILERVIVHELEHAMTRCSLNQPRKPNCNAILCEEIRAVKRDRRCEFNEQGTHTIPRDEKKYKKCVLDTAAKSVFEQGCSVDNNDFERLYAVCNPS